MNLMNLELRTLLKSIFFVSLPAIVLCYLFSVNVIKLDAKVTRIPAVQKMFHLITLEDDANPKNWYSEVAPKKKTLAQAQTSAR